MKLQVQTEAAVDAAVASALVLHMDFRAIDKYIFPKTMLQCFYVQSLRHLEIYVQFIPRFSCECINGK